jgi:hypothetical protein
LNEPRGGGAFTDALDGISVISGQVADGPSETSRASEDLTELAARRSTMVERFRKAR